MSNRWRWDAHKPAYDFFVPVRVVFADGEVLLKVTYKILIKGAVYDVLFFQATQNPDYDTDTFNRLWVNKRDSFLSHAISGKEIVPGVTAKINYDDVTATKALNTFIDKVKKGEVRP